MDFANEIRAFSAGIETKLPYINSEAITRSSLVDPLLRILGYDPSDPTEVVPEYGANLDLPGVPKNQHVDYGIRKDSENPIILIEVKQFGTDPGVGLGQLFNYFHKVDDARIGIATNGVIYRFYSDLRKPNMMDEEPYLEIDLLNLRESDIEALKKLTKSVFNIDNVISAAGELKYIGGILQILNLQVTQPDDEFAKFFFTKLGQGPFRGQIKERFLNFTQRALQQFIREQVYKAIETGIGKSPVSEPETKPATPETSTEDEITIESPKIQTTEEELQGYYLIKSILWQVVDGSSLTYKDTQSYFNILLNNNTWKPVCRLYFNNSESKKLELVTVKDDGKKEYQKVAIDSLDDIYQYADRLKATVAAYEQ